MLNNELNTNLLQASQKIEHSLYIAKVVSVPSKDKKERGRYRVRINGITPLEIPDTDCPFAEVIGMLLQGKQPHSSGFNGSLELGTFVYVMFLHNDVAFPTIIGVARGNKDNLSFFDDDISGFESKSGHQLIFNDKAGEESILIKHGKKATSILLDVDGNIKILTENDLIFDVKKDHKITVAGDSSIKVNGDSSINVDGDTTIKTTKLKITSDMSNNGNVAIVGDLSVSGSISDSIGNVTTHTHVVSGHNLANPRV